VPFGSIGLTLFGLDLALATSAAAPAYWRMLGDLALIGVFGGFYIVPLYALVQSRSEAQHRSRIIAGNNVLNAVFMVAAAALAIGLFAAGLTIPQLFLAVALMNAAVALFIYQQVPEFLMRFMVWILIHTVYRLEKTGLERIPEEGAAIVVCNHVSYVDALVISAACRRPIRWVMYHRIFAVPLLSFFFRTARAIPIAPAKEDAKLLEAAYEAVARELADGQLVGLFPEGQLTSDGEIGEFRGGVTKILERTPVPVVPLALSGLWHSVFARSRGKGRRGVGLFRHIRLAIGAPVAAPEVAPERLRATVLELRGDWR
jgi:1-acyl-sn-glycerol-3-phosphate acyltransferase